MKALITCEYNGVYYLNRHLPSEASKPYGEIELTEEQWLTYDKHLGEFMAWQDLILEKLK